MFAFKPKIGNKLKELRIKNNYTLEEVGIKVGISKQTLYKYEHNIVSNIPYEKIELLANLYKTSPSSIIGWTDNIVDAHYKEDVLLKIAKELNDEDLDFIIDLASRLRGK